MTRASPKPSSAPLGICKGFWKGTVVAVVTASRGDGAPWTYSRPILLSERGVRAAWAAIHNMLYTFRRIYNIQVSRDLPSVHNTDPISGFHNKRYTFRPIDTIQVSRGLVLFHHSVRRNLYRNNFRRVHYSLRGC